MRDLTVAFDTPGGRVRVVEALSFEVAPGQSVGLVGESGCGKSVTAMAIMRLLASPPAVIEGGRIEFRGENLLELSERRMRHVRGDRIGMIFQDPMTSLNPVYTIAFQLVEAQRLHRDVGAGEARARAVELLGLVGVGAAERRMDQYPHELSGGLCQRIMIAMALACEPRLLIADEPTTALDVTIQAQILKLVSRLRHELGMSLLMITHDLGVVAQVCDRVEVMYAGRIVERASARALFRRPRHPYTHGLLASSPRLGKRSGKLQAIPGVVPQPGERGRGCYFADRCPRVLARCRHETPPLATLESGHEAACWNPVPA